MSETEGTLNPATLRQLEERIFTAGESSVEAEAAAFSRSVLEATIRESRAAMRAVTLALPDRAFAAQPARSDGEPVWSAGEIAGHIAESMLWLQYALAKLAGNQPQAPAAPDLIAVRDRTATIEMLDFADRALDEALNTARGIAADASLPIEGLGNLGVRGLLLLHAMHEVAHANQLRELGEI